ncbi:MAG: hypothetical protein ACMXYG_06255 [Candidatus Woesearchaeota archaeon]
MIGMHWGFVKLVTNLLFILILVTFPIYHTLSVVLLFALIAFWSRIPGTSIPSPLWVLYMIDLVDLFSLIVAINISGPAGALLAFFGNFVPRIGGITPAWSDVIKDSIIQPLICLIMPFIYAIVQDITVCMVIYTLLRQIGFFIANFVYPEYGSFPQYVILFIAYTTTQTLINYLYGKYFGAFFDTIIKEGIKFNIWLFIITVVIVIIINGITTAKTSNIINILIKKTIRNKKRNDYISDLNKKDNRYRESGNKDISKYDLDNKIIMDLKKEI